MAKVQVDCSVPMGKMRPMHSVNNGPAGSRVRGGFSNYSEFEAAKIPYARTHDSAFSSYYGGEHTVDVHRIFKNFDADPDDPASYLFEATDQYMKDLESVGTKPFYRLGAGIEHSIRWGTYPPKDFLKWAVICEHIIRHYTEGWANGFRMDIEYWEIWNEPDEMNYDGWNACWGGTQEEFIEFFVTVLRHLKTCFPHLKIGGPAFCVLGEEYTDRLLDAVKKNRLTLDFFSFHCYANTPQRIAEDAAKGIAFLKKHGFDSTESVLNEWNYVKGWRNEEWIYTIKNEKGLKGASFIASSMCACHRAGLDHLMYYDARPCGMCGMFDTDFLTPLKGYYPFLMFSQLYEMKNCIQSASDCQELYCAAAKGGDGSCGLLLSYFDDNDDAAAKDVRVDFRNLDVSVPRTAEYYLLDENHNAELVRSEKITMPEFTAYLHMELFTTYLIKIV